MQGMVFDLRGLHLGDVLLASPAMRAGDVVIAKPEHRSPFLPVEWADAGRATVFPKLGHCHETLAWLEAASRIPVRHAPTLTSDRDLLLIAPTVKHPAKQWPSERWRELKDALPGSVLIDGSVPRNEWIAALSQAHTVICPDTGTVHMADVLGVPNVVGLYGLGQKHFNRYHPYWTQGEKCLVQDSMTDITVTAVLEKLNG